MPLRFGTDGVRGVANDELTPEFVLSLGRAAARVLGPGPFLVGRDPRVSGPLLQAALCAGMAAEGVTSVDLGVLPTPGVAFASAESGLPGAVVSASHNPFADNGVKLFAPGGRKLDGAAEAAIESELARAGQGPTGAGVGTLRSDPGPALDYADHLAASLEGRRLDGLRVVLDCANGAASAVAPAVLQRLGAEVRAVAAEPDGTNINDGCGSTHPSKLQAEVVALAADAGLAFDGDADRVLAVDAGGGLVDGDHMLALCALDLRGRGRLRGDTVVTTVMANLGLRRAMEQAGIGVHETPVGDRHVLAALDKGGWALGGEQSGHIVFPDLATTGDGILTGLLVLDLVVRGGGSLADMAAAAMTKVPQVVRNIRIPRGSLRDEVVARLAPAVAEVESELGDDGRVLVRASGTEPLVRVMVEATSAHRAEQVADRLVLEARAAGGASGTGS